MKGFFITIAVLVAAGFYALTSFGKIGSATVEKIAAEEKGREAILQALKDSSSEQAFVFKYLPLLKRRWTVAYWALILDEGYFMALSDETVKLYAETPLEQVQPYGRFLFERAKRLEQVPSMVGEAFALYKKHQVSLHGLREVTLMALANLVHRRTRPTLKLH